MTLRALATGSCTGDMGIWVRRSLFDLLGGFAPLTAFEDLQFSDRARRQAAHEVIDAPLLTSARRWEKEGINRTVLRMWSLRLGYRLGIAPQRLAQWYRSHPRAG